MILIIKNNLLIKIRNQNHIFLSKDQARYTNRLKREIINGCLTIITNMIDRDEFINFIQNTINIEKYAILEINQNTQYPI